MKFRYLSVYFCTEDRRADTTYTFLVAKEADPVNTLESYASKMACNGSDDKCVDVFQRYVKKFQSEEIPLPAPI